MKNMISFLMLWVIGMISTVSAADTIRLATTTSTDNSGLLKALLPDFEKSTGNKVHVIAVGTGKALRMGRDGDVDVVLVHARAAEEKFIADGSGVKRYPVMHNDFVIVGPAADPAGILGLKDAAEALRKIRQKQAIFVSRGDDSGTHKKEKILWTEAGQPPVGKWYYQAGQGMGKVLQMASELQGYTMADRGTWLAMRDKLDLQILVEGDQRLFNPYGIIAVNPEKHPGVNYQGAMALINWMISPETKALIGNFKVRGEQLFIPEE
jgi:tungstate transport system substrate-binding protein